ncbi:hypothetical protein [Methanobacterium sp.]|uniref:hypothetical protein n=2 Tax=unclassified Methanobacterium TaxID=2627676 RepID=UPI003D65CDDD
MMATQQISGGAMIGWAIILAIILLLFPGLVIWFAWFSVFVLLFGGIAALFAK